MITAVRVLGAALVLAAWTAIGCSGGMGGGGGGSGGDGGSVGSAGNVGSAGSAGSGGSVGPGGSGGGGGSSVPGSTKIMTLTPAQATQVCNDLVAYENQNISTRNLCKLAGIQSAVLIATIDPTLTDTDLGTACNIGVDQCNSDPNGAGSCPLGEPSTCTPTPTVDDLTKCVMDDVAATNATLAALPACSTVTRAWLNANGSSAGKVTTPASCTALHAQCPDILASP